MEERIKFVHAFEVEEEPTLTEVCERFSVSRKTGYKWLERYAEGGLEALKDQPRVAHTQPRRLSLELEDLIVELRKSHSKWGPKKLRSILMERKPGVGWPSASTFGEVLKRRGLIRPRKRRISVLRGGAGALFCNAPNDVWCQDFKGSFLLGDQQRCHPYTLTDGYSRYILKCEGKLDEKGEAVRIELTRAFEEFGIPARLRSDNGPPFGAQTQGGLSRLAIWAIKLGIVPEFITPGEPQENGRHERMHRTLKEETADPPKSTMPEQQQAFDHFRREFNEERPHEALGQVPPCKRYEPSRRPYTGKLTSPEYIDCEVRYASPNGRVGFRGKKLYVGHLLGREPVGFQQVGEALFEVRYGPVKLGFFLESEQTPRLRPEPPRNTSAAPLDEKAPS